MDLLVIQLKRDEAILATFRKKRGMVSFVGAERHSLAESGDLSDILKRGAGPQEQRVILSLLPEHLYLREVELPISDRDKVRELLPMELKGETLLDTDALVFDALPLANGKFLAVWGRTKELSESIERLRAAGLEPEVVTSSLFHWGRLAPAQGTFVVTDGEAVAAYRDRMPLFFRALPATGENELARTVTTLEIAKEIEVEKVLRYEKDAEESVEPEAELAEAFGDDRHAVVALAGAYAVAAAVADGSVVNLRRGPLAYTAGAQKLYRKLRVPMILAAVLVLLAFGEAGVRYYLVKKDVTSLDNTIKGIYKEVFPTRKKPVDEVAELRSEIKRLEGAKTSSNVLKLLKDLAEAKGDDVTGFYETEIEGTDVRLKGDARTFQAANDFKARAGKLLDGAEVSEVKSKPDGSVGFSFRGKLKGVSQ